MVSWMVLFTKQAQKDARKLASASPALKPSSSSPRSTRGWFQASEVAGNLAGERQGWAKGLDAEDQKSSSTRRRRGAWPGWRAASRALPSPSRSGSATGSS